MPINRAPFNSLVDDDGSNTVGTVWNKSQIQGVILDPADAALAWTEVQTALTGTQHNFNPGINPYGHTIIRCLGDVTITGFPAGFAGQRIRVVASSTLVQFPHGSGSAVGNQLSNFATSGATLIYLNGNADYQYSAVSAAWVLRAHEQGAWITAPYSGAAFDGTVNFWTVDAGDIVALRYRLTGRTLMVNVTLNATSVGLNASGLRIANTMWGGFTSAAVVYGAGSVFEGATGLSCRFKASGTVVVFEKHDSAVFATTTNGTYAYGQVAFEVT